MRFLSLLLLGLCAVSDIFMYLILVSEYDSYEVLIGTVDLQFVSMINIIMV